jgi:S-methylmethionine-dependent homocysteine/selenocysteine methylase
MSRSITVLDGGTGRELHRVGAPFRQPEWSALALIEAPEAVRRVHETYLAAGADVITSNSYALNPFHIGAERFAAEGQTLADRAGRMGRAAIGQGPGRLAGSLPPVLGSYRPDLFDPQMATPLLQTLIDGLTPHVDLWLAETLSSIAEARLVRQVLGASSHPLWVSFTLRDDGDPAAAVLRSGEPAAEAAHAALAIGAETLLFNCSQPEVMLGAVTAARAAIGSAALTLGVYANAFPPQRPDALANDGLDPIREDLDTADYVAFARAWQAAGAAVIGGCCGIGPAHIRALADAFEV